MGFKTWKTFNACQAPGSLPEGCYVEFSDVQGCAPWRTGVDDGGVQVGWEAVLRNHKRNPKVRGFSV